MRLGDVVVVYSDSGIISLSPRIVEQSFSYTQAPVEGPGLRSQNHADGDDSIHGYIGLDNNFYVLRGPNVERRGTLNIYQGLTVIKLLCLILMRMKRSS